MLVKELIEELKKFPEDADVIVTSAKYKGRSIMSVLSENPAYVEWCVNHIEWFTLGC